MDEVSDEPLYRDRVCGIDIGKAEMHATIRVPSDANPARRMSETRAFATTRRAGGAEIRRAFRLGPLQRTRDRVDDLRHRLLQGFADFGARHQRRRTRRRRPRRSGGRG